MVVVCEGVTFNFQEIGERFISMSFQYYSIVVSYFIYLVLSSLYVDLDDIGIT